MHTHKPKTAKVLGFFLSTKFLFLSTKHLIFYLFIFYSLFSTLHAQSNIRISGKVHDLEDGSPLENVLIQIKGTLFYDYSDNLGLFEIENVQPGSFTITISLVGYESQKINRVHILKDITEKINIKLKRSILFTDPIVTEADRIENTTDLSGNKIVINVEEEKDRGFVNLTQILQQVAGLQIVSPGGGENRAVIKIHGSEANQVLVLLDGNRLNNPQTGDVDLAEIPFNEIENIEVIRHGNTAIYGGGAFAGVVNFKTKQHVESTFVSAKSRIASFSTLSGQLSGGFALGNFFSRLNYYQDYSDQDFSYQYEGQNFKRENAWFRNSNFYYKINYSLISHLFFVGYSQRIGERGLPSAFFNQQNVYGAKMQEKSQRIQANYKWLPDPAFFLEILNTFNHLDQNFNNEKDPSPFTKYNNIFINSTTESQLISNLHLINKVHSKIGLHFLKETLERKDKIYPTLSTEEKSRETKAIFTGLEYQFPQNKIIWKNLKLNAAIRYQKYFTQKFEFFPSFGFSYNPQFIDEINISGNWAKSVRYPDFNSLFWQGGVQSQGNPDLLPEKKTGLNTTITIDFKQMYYPNIYISYFFENLKDLIFWEQIRNNHWQPRNLNKAEKEGWDVQIKQNIFLEYLSLRSSYSRINAINKSGEPTTHNKKLVFTPDHTVTASLLGKFNHFNSMISFRYVSERQTVKANTGEPLPEYSIWDASVSYKREIGKYSFNLELAVENFIDEQYQLLRGYPMPSKNISALVQLDYNFK